MKHTRAFSPFPAGAAILIVGATSAIAKALAAVFAADKKRLILAGRDENELKLIATDLRMRYCAEVETRSFDALDFTSHAAFFDNATRAFEEGLAGVILCYGLLPDQSAAQASSTLCREAIDANFSSEVCLLEIAAAYFEQKPGTFICGLSSVAGERGRQSNYIYGAAKGGFTLYLQGLRNRLYHKGVAVITVKPGFVDTAMTWGIVNADSPMVASPATVAADIAAAVRRRADVIYTPWFWKIIMKIVTTIPEPIFKRMKM